jgi:hypothetical protein
MADEQFIAQQILDLTRVVTDADAAQPGKPVRVSVLPGFSAAPTVSTNFDNVTLTGTLAGTIKGTLDTFVEAIVFKVSVGVRKDVGDAGQGGTPAEKGVGHDFIATPDVGVNLAGDPLDIAFFLKPPVGEDTVFNEPARYAIDVTLSVKTELLSAPVTKIITVPVAVPAVEIPALVLLGSADGFATYDGDGAASLLVMVKASSALRDLGAVVATLNSLMGLARTLESLLVFGGLFIKALSDAADIISRAPTVYFSVGNAPVLDDNGLDIEGVISSLLLIGVHDGSNVQLPDGDGNVPTVPGVTQVTLYSDEGFDKDGIDEEHTTFSVEEQVFGGFHTGVGLLRIESFSNMKWASDPGEDMDGATSSVRWGGIP